VSSEQEKETTITLRYATAYCLLLVGTHRSSLSGLPTALSNAAKDDRCHARLPENEFWLPSQCAARPSARSRDLLDALKRREAIPCGVRIPVEEQALLPELTLVIGLAHLQLNLVGDFRVF